MSFKRIWITVLIVVALCLLLPGLYLFTVFGYCALFSSSGRCI